MRVADICQFFPDRLRQPWMEIKDKWGEITQIRIRTGKKVIIEQLDREEYLKNKDKTDVIYNGRDVEDIFKHLCHDSVYAYEKERMMGVMTVQGGHRIGIAGEIVQNEKGNIIKYVKYMNIRIAHEITGVSNQIISYLMLDSMPCNTLIISPPGVGKTTLLRDIVKNYSNMGYTVGLIDERGEIAASYRGEAMFDCGSHTDIITGGNKLLDGQIFVRTFSPRIVAMDEIGAKSDSDIIFYAKVSGCSVLTTAHGRSIEDIKSNPDISLLTERGCFERFVVLSCEGVSRTANVFDGKGNKLCCVKL